MANTNLTIIGSRSRPDNVVRAFKALKKVSKISDFALIINKDQEDLYPKIDGVTTHVVDSHLGVNGKFNAVVHQYLDKYETITGIDDDCLVQTDGWDEILYEPIKRIGYGLSYGNDGIQGERLPTKVMISTNITRTLGYWCPPTLFHSYADDFWKLIGEFIDSLHYFEDVNMEHLHWMNGKAEIDDTYRTNTPEQVQKDKQAFNKYLEKDLYKDVDKLKKALGTSKEVKIAVYAIAKNEAKHVERWVKATQKADLRVVVDTGSEDDTYERLLRYPVEAHKATVEPFRFDVARNIALDKIPPDIDVCVSIDMDEVPDPDLFDKLRAGWKPDTGRAWVMWDTGNIWANNNRVHARHGYRWKYPCHEIIVPDAGKDNLIVVESCVRHQPDNDKSRGQYLHLLEQGYVEAPDDARMLVYLVREYYFKGMWEKIIEVGPRIDELKDVWNVELAQTYRGIGEAYCKLGDDQEGLKWYLKNVDTAPEDLEAWMPLAFYYYERQMWQECLQAADKVNELSLESNKHYVADASMPWRMYDLMSIASWNLELKGSAKKWARKAMELNPDDERLRGNYDFIVRQTARDYKNGLS